MLFLRCESALELALHVLRMSCELAILMNNCSPPVGGNTVEAVEVALSILVCNVLGASYQTPSNQKVMLIK